MIEIIIYNKNITNIKMPKFQLVMEPLNSGIYIRYLQGKYSNHSRQHSHHSNNIAIISSIIPILTIK